MAYIEYLRWLNPLNLKVEENPKQHDGSQEFQGLRDWESSIQPAPDEDGTTRYLGPNDLKALDGLTTESEDFVMSPEDQKVFEELRQKEDYQEDIVVVD